MRYVLMVVMFVAFAAKPVRAQSVEYELPTSYDLVPGRLSVAFADSVSESKARALVSEAGYEVLDAHFLPLRITVAHETDAAAAALRQHPGVTDVQRDAALVEHTPTLTLTFDTTVTETDAVALLNGLGGYRIVQIMRSPQDLTVSVPEGDEETAITLLETLSGVRYVSYVNAE